MMNDQISEILEKIVRVGDELCSAIVERELDKVQQCLDRRSQLLARLQSYEAEHGPANGPNHQGFRETLDRQHKEITEAFDRYRSDIEQELEKVTEYQKVQSAYGTNEVSPRRILNQNVRG